MFGLFIDGYVCFEMLHCKLVLSMDNLQRFESGDIGHMKQACLHKEKDKDWNGDKDEPGGKT